MDHPANYAVELLSRSVYLLAVFLFSSHISRISFQSCSQEKAVKHAPIELVHGDFLKNSAVRDAISTAGLVYMNNPRFGPELNLKVLSQ